MVKRTKFLSYLGYICASKQVHYRVEQRQQQEQQQQRWMSLVISTLVLHRYGICGIPLVFQDEVR